MGNPVLKGVQNCPRYGPKRPYIDVFGGLEEWKQKNTAAERTRGGEDFPNVAPRKIFFWPRRGSIRVSFRGGA